MSGCCVHGSIPRSPVAGCSPSARVAVVFMDPFPVRRLLVARLRRGWAVVFMDPFPVRRLLVARLRRGWAVVFMDPFPVRRCWLLAIGEGGLLCSWIHSPFAGCWLLAFGEGGLLCSWIHSPLTGCWLLAFGEGSVGSRCFPSVGNRPMRAVMRAERRCRSTWLGASRSIGVGRSPTPLPPRGRTGR